MKKWLLLLVLIGALTVFVAGCADRRNDEPKDTPAEAPGEAPTDSAAGGSRLAPGLHDMEDGRVQAIGTLVYRDIEGGFYAIVGGTESEGNKDETAAVIANEDEFRRQLEPLKGKMVSAIGTRFDGASIRMAGPEIIVESIEEISDTPGIAE